MDDEISKLSEEERAKLTALKAELQRDGDVALDRFIQQNPVTTCFRILAALYPKASRDALEDALIESGLTNADIRAMAEKAKYKQ